MRVFLSQGPIPSDTDARIERPIPSDTDARSERR